MFAGLPAVNTSTNLLPGSYDVMPDLLKGFQGILPGDILLPGESPPRDNGGYSGPNEGTGPSIRAFQKQLSGIGGLLSSIISGDFSIEGLKSLADELFESLKQKGLDTLGGIAEDLFGSDGIGKILSDFIKQGDFSLDSLKQLALDILGDIAESIFSDQGGLGGVLSKFVDKGGDLLGGLIDNILGGLGDLGSSLFGKGGLVSGLIGGIGDVLGGIFGFLFAGGGVMTAQGPMPLQRYAAGGVAIAPQLALFGEGSRPEAYVPLPDGRSIPVKLFDGSAERIRRGGGMAVRAPIDVTINSNFPLDKGSGKQINTGVARAIHQEVAGVFNELLRQQTRLGGMLNPI